MKSFVPRKYQDKDKKSRNSYRYNQDPGPVNAPTPRPFIRIYCKFRTPKPKDMIGNFMIWVQENLTPDTLHSELNKLYPAIQVFTMIPNRHFLIQLDKQVRWDRLVQNIRKTIEAI